MAEGSLARSSLWAALSQLATTGLGGLAALAVLLTFGKGADTDAVFAAYGVYGALLVVCVSLRTSIVARVIESASPWASFDRFLGAGLSLLLAAGVVMVGAGDPVADVITGSLGESAHDDARWSLAILWVATSGQLVAALGAAVLGIRDEFAFIGVAYGCGGVLTIGALLGLSGPLDILSVPTGMAMGAFLTAALMVWRMRALGYRPSGRALREGLSDRAAAAIIVAGSTSPLALQLSFVVSVSFAALMGVGAVTIYTAAFFTAGALAGVTASALSVVLAAPVAVGWNRVAEDLVPHLRTILRAGLLLIAPVVGVVALAGDEVVDLVLGSTFTAKDSDRLAVTFLVLTGFLVGTLAAQIPLLAAYALSRYRAVTLVSAVVLVLHVGASALAEQADDVAWLGVAASVSALASMALLLWLIHGPATPRVVGMVLRETAVVALVAGVAYGVPGVAAAAAGGGLWDALGAVAGTALLGVGVRVLLPEHLEVAIRMIGPLLPSGSGGRARPVPGSQADHG